MGTQRGNHRPQPHDRPARGTAGNRARTGKSPNEGEGSRSAARDYNQRTERFIHEGRVEKSADEAKRAIESPERDELLDAEKIGRGPGRT